MASNQKANGQHQGIYAQEIGDINQFLRHDFKGLEPRKNWNFSPAKIDNSQDHIVVIIGNRNYKDGVPLVHYAHNDAKAMREFFTHSLQIPKENILYYEDASKGDFEGIFKARLPNRVKAGKTHLWVYYTGHGLPVDGDAKLLPVDSRPDTAAYTGYSRAQLLADLKPLDAAQTTLILDACFTGISAGANLLPGAKALYRRVTDFTPPQNGLIISAAKAEEASWMDDGHELSLMTLYLLEGLSGKADDNQNNIITSHELQAYLDKTVPQAALRLYNQAQNPQIIGKRRDVIEY